jgi:hypothetical protein
MSSANYTIVSCVVDAGGGGVTSPGYLALLSLGEPVTGISSSSDSFLYAGFVATAQAVAHIPGDFNGNAIVNVQDAALLLRVAGGLENASAPGLDWRAGNIAPNPPDTRIDMRDAIAVLRYINGLQPTLP